MKREAREVMHVVRGLTAMTAKQLDAVGHLLPLGALEAVGIAARLPRSNQGRKRQEGLIAKLLRAQLGEAQLAKLEDAVALAAQNSGLWEDGDVAGLVAGWQEGLLEDDPAVVAEVYGYPAEWGPDHQHLRTLVRQCQQALAEEAAAAPAAEVEGGAAARAQLGAPAAADGSASDGGSSGSGSDGEGREGAAAAGEEDHAEELAAVLAEARARAGGGGGGGAATPVGGGARRRRKAPEPRSRGLLRSLGRALRPLAKRVVQEGEGALGS